MNFDYCVCDGWPNTTLAVADAGVWGEVIHRFNTREEAEAFARAEVAGRAKGVTVVRALSGGGYARVSSWYGDHLVVQTWRALKDKHPSSPIPWFNITREWCDWAHEVLRTVEYRGSKPVDVEVHAISGNLEALEAIVVPRFEVLR